MPADEHDETSPCNIEPGFCLFYHLHKPKLVFLWALPLFAAIPFSGLALTHLNLLLLLLILLIVMFLLFPLQPLTLSSLQPPLLLLCFFFIFRYRFHFFFPLAFASFLFFRVSLKAETERVLYSSNWLSHLSLLPFGHKWLVTVIFLFSKNNKQETVIKYSSTVYLLKRDWTKK